jgi:hypothetical protein
MGMSTTEKMTAVGLFIAVLGVLVAVVIGVAQMGVGVLTTEIRRWAKLDPQPGGSGSNPPPISQGDTSSNQTTAPKVRSPRFGRPKFSIAVNQCVGNSGSIVCIFVLTNVSGERRELQEWDPMFRSYLVDDRKEQHNLFASILISSLCDRLRNVSLEANDEVLLTPGVLFRLA